MESSIFWTFLKLHISGLKTILLYPECQRGTNEQLLKTSGADVLSSSKNTQKTSRGGGATISPLVRPRVNLTMFVFEQISQGKVFDEVLYKKESHSKLENIDF